MLPSTEEELQLHLERKTKREAERQLAAAKSKAHGVAQAKHAEAALQAKTAGVITSFAKRAKEAALAARATLDDAEFAAAATAVEGAATTAEDAATTFADATTTQG